MSGGGFMGLDGEGMEQTTPLPRAKHNPLSCWDHRVGSVWGRMARLGPIFGSGKCHCDFEAMEVLGRGRLRRNNGLPSQGQDSSLLVSSLFQPRCTLWHPPLYPPVQFPVSPGVHRVWGGDRAALRLLRGGSGRLSQSQP